MGKARRIRPTARDKSAQLLAVDVASDQCLTAEQPGLIHVSAPRKHVPSNGVIVHRRLHLDAARHRRFPITSIAQTLLDLRVAGFLVIRYTRAQVVVQPERVAADLTARLAERRLELAQALAQRSL